MAQTNKANERVVNQTDDDGFQIIIRHSDDQVSNNFHEGSEKSEVENETKMNKGESSSQIQGGSQTSFSEGHSKNLKERRPLQKR